MLGMYLTTAVNFLANTPKTMTEGMTSIWTGLISVLWKVKEGITNILPEIMVFLGDTWIILIPPRLMIVLFYLIKVICILMELVLTMRKKLIVVKYRELF
ncbi:Spiroplasmavirus-related protein [Spiroplasma kunkelii CR2-3x]|uniref:Spiroplasmavirus-related protein n=1 Tax=Spiroplasma kunkelii CR2-3x TaxID=273035 RepID=A0A0K2JIH8_SPIKU|nr:hypothetical protein [Spiroplasma kunkelii]ALA98036.1 Spiroplasmavirus-related protein [Spiroplasma kunkelii CR2-3x]